MNMKIEKTQFGNILTLNDTAYSLPFYQGSLHNLTHADYGEGFEMVTFGELVPLLYWANSSQDRVAREVMRAFKTAPIGELGIFGGSALSVMGDTGVLCTDEGMYVQDNLKFKYEYKVLREDGQFEIIDVNEYHCTPDEMRKVNVSLNMQVEALEAKLSDGSFRQHGIVFSSDRRLRYVRNECYNQENTTNTHLRTNPYVIALVRDMDRVEMLFEIASKHRYPNSNCVEPPLKGGHFGVAVPTAPSLDMNWGRLHISPSNGVYYGYFNRMAEVLSCGVRKDSLDYSERIKLPAFRPKEFSDEIIVDAITGQARTSPRGEQKFLQKMLRLFGK